MTYTREFLIDAYVSRYQHLGEEVASTLRHLAEQFYDRVGKDEFRKYASLDAEALRVYRNQLAAKI